MGKFIPENFKIENIPLSSIKQYKNNPKIHNNKQVQQIMNSITEFKFTNPVLLDENNEIIAGHGRFLAAQKLGSTKIPAIKLLYLNEAQKKAYRIADNKLTENGEWNFDLLKIEFQDIENLNFDCSLDITGFIFNI
jgi:ParB-like chromosome segregation protein Spo0J